MNSHPQHIDKKEDLLKLNDALFKLLLEFKDYAIIRIDAEGLVISWNTGAEQIYGFTEEEVLGKHISVFFTEEEIQAKEPWKNLKKAKDSGRYEHEGWKHKKDGSMFYAHTILTAFYKADNSVSGFAKVTRNITARKKLEEENKVLAEQLEEENYTIAEQLEEKVNQRTKELEIVNKELEAFSYSVSHDLRAPLRAVSGYAMMLKEDYEAKLDAEGKRIIEKIIENGRLMGQLIDDLLSFSKMARLEVISDDINMKQLAEECMNTLLSNEAHKLYSIKISDLPACKGDASMLNQVWYNLIGNAIKYSSKKDYPQIEIGAVDDDKFNIYYVKDNGSGFDMKYADKLFGVFQRLHRQDEFEGTGLGLALTKRIVSKHLGEIWGEGAVGNGAIFHFSIPK